MPRYAKRHRPRPRHRRYQEEDRAKAFIEQEHPTVKESKLKIPPKIEQHPEAFMAGRTAGLLARLTHRVGLSHTEGNSYG